MRYSRVFVVLGLVAAVAAGGVALAFASSPSPRARPAAAPVSHLQLRQTLRREVQQFLRHQTVRPAVPHVLMAPGGTCFADGCSEVPCVIPVQASGAVSIVTSTGGVAQPPVAGVPTPRSPTIRTPSIVTPQVLPVPRNQACPGGKVAPRTLRVTGP